MKWSIADGSYFSLKNKGIIIIIKNRYLFHFRITTVVWRIDMYNHAKKVLFFVNLSSIKLPPGCSDFRHPLHVSSVELISCITKVHYKLFFATQSITSYFELQLASIMLYMLLESTGLLYYIIYLVYVLSSSFTWATFLQTINWVITGFVTYGFIYTSNTRTTTEVVY